MAKASREDSLYSREEVRAKILVLLHMSIECALKCVVALADPNGDLIERYKVVKGGGHSLAKLVDLIAAPEFDGILRDRLKAFNPPGVTLRYGFELIVSDPDRLFESGRSPGLEDDKLNDAFELAEATCEIANRLHKAVYKSIFEWQNGDSPQRVVARIKDAINRNWK
jgi:hypothetical protein